MNGITFGNIESYDDLNLILSSVKIPPASPKTTYINIPGADGSLDLTEALGDVKFSDRQATFVFNTLPTDDISAKQSEVSNALDGVYFEKITLDKDSDWYWSGRCSVSAYDDNYPTSKITVKATLNPYKRKQTLTTINDTLTTAYKNIVLPNSRKKVIPEITVTRATMVKFGTTEKTLSIGTHKILDLVLIEGNNTVQAKNTTRIGTITFTYREGEL